MEREREEAAAEAAAAKLRAAANAELSRGAVPLVERIAQENYVQVADAVRPTPLVSADERATIDERATSKRTRRHLQPSQQHAHNLREINARYKKMGAAMVQRMAAGKARTQKRRDEHIAAYDDRYAAWLRRVEKSESNPKKMFVVFCAHFLSSIRAV